MKKLQILLFASLFVISTGCKHYLDEKSNGALFGADALKSQQGLEAALTGAYKGWGSTWGTGFLHATAIAATMGGDDVTTHKASNKSDFREFDSLMCLQPIKEHKRYTVAVTKRYKVLIM